MLLRNIRQMYYSRAYCQPRLQRFMIRAQPPPPPPPPPSEEERAQQPPSYESVTTASKAEVDAVRNFAGVVVFVYQAFIRSKHNQESFTCLCQK